jgi:hypothetical protein
MELEREGKDLLKQVSQEDAEKAGIGDLFKQVKDAYKKSRDWR